MSDDVITIDGPAASGKSTVAKRVADELSLIHIDSGSLYRAITWQALRNGIVAAQATISHDFLDAMQVSTDLKGNSITFLVDGTDPGLDLRSQSVAAAVSDVAAVPDVRRKVTECLRQAAQSRRAVVEGRDIGSVVFPNARFKFYLDATADERARRRHAESTVPSSGVQEVLHALQTRDRKDSTRSASPLTIPSGAVVIDTTTLSIDSVVDTILSSVSDDAGKAEKEVIR